MKTVLFVAGALWWSSFSMAFAAGDYYHLVYPPSAIEGELPVGATFTLWIPEGVQTLRGVIVHQHGCGVGACQGGETAAYDLHWQALAKKWDCALLGPSYRQNPDQNCRLWCDPRNGSDKTFQQALNEFSTMSGHSELNDVPWCLWGHSGGGFWASIMQALHPERIVAIWFRSGTAYEVWEREEIPKVTIPDAAYGIPMMMNPGIQEREKVVSAWTGATSMFAAYRAKGAPVAIAPDPRTNHECGDSRYLAIPFFDVCLAMRLPDAGSADQTLKPIDESDLWLAEPLSETAVPASKYSGQREEAMWLPNESLAKAWMEYVKVGSTSDKTPPPAPFDVTATALSEGGVVIEWDCEADFESGLLAFEISCDGERLAQSPAEPRGRYGRPLFQGMSYHDTPDRPLLPMRFFDTDATPGMNHHYEVLAINSVGLKSESVAANDKESQNVMRTAGPVIFGEQLVSGDYGYAYGIAAADLDHDGDLDLTSADADRGSLVWYENVGDGRLTKHPIQENEEGWFERHVLGDINGDGHTDVVVVKNLHGDVVWFENDGSPSDETQWKRHVIIAKELPGAYDVALGDFDGDGDLDVAASSWSRGNMFVWFENPGSNGFDNPWTMRVIEAEIKETRTICVADFNNDGKPDLLGTATVSSLLVWYENSGNPADEGWIKHVIDDQSLRPTHGHPADVDRDGDFDVVVALGFPGGDDSDHQKVMWYENVGSPGSGSEWTAHEIGRLPAAFEAISADVDNDGDFDIVATRWGPDGQVVWFEQPADLAMPWSKHDIKTGWTRANQVIAADIDADGLIDIAAVAERGSNQFFIWWNKGRVEK
ncbi:MAG: VCBS repeat-containing protein [Planctomycetota bacterium]|nr:VCBS repeat-containing protein [Planctomycetota bacterium]MDA1214488.1 VCBS repeat-containing protein [Planctomycetota bacterium]